MKIFKEKQSGLTSFVSFERLLDESISEAIGRKPNERIIGIYIGEDGITVYLEYV